MPCEFCGKHAIGYVRIIRGDAIKLDIVVCPPCKALVQKIQEAVGFP